MREIKFRAIKDDMSFEFSYGNGICYSPSGMPRIPDENGMFYTCLKGTDGQYTGLKDKNGVEIYNGDILKDMYGSIKTIDWAGSAFTFNKGEDYLPNDLLDYEVIGNIHQNPDLLQ